VVPIRYAVVGGIFILLEWCLFPKMRKIEKMTEVIKAITKLCKTLKDLNSIFILMGHFCPYKTGI
jgi:hypothetical protein